MNTHDRISKVGFKEGVLVVAIEHENERQKKDTTVTFKEEPHPDLLAAFAALEEFVREVLLWPSNLYKDVVEVKSVSFSKSEKSGVEGAVISGCVKLEDDPSGFNWNTPHRPFEQYNESEHDGNGATLWSDDAQAAFRDVRKETYAFVEGTKRRQGDLFSHGKDAAAGERPETMDESVSRIGELTEQVVQVVDAMIQPYLQADGQGAPREAVDPVTGEVKPAYSGTDFVSHGPGVVEGVSEAGKTLVEGAVKKGFAERTGKANVVRLSGGAWDEKANAQ